MINFLKRHDNKQSFPVGGSQPSIKDYNSAKAENESRRASMSSGQRNDPMPHFKFYVWATNKFVQRGNREFGIKGTPIDMWGAETSAQAQDAVRTLQNNKNYSNAQYSPVAPKLPRNSSLAVTHSKPEFVFGEEAHQKRMEGIKDYTAEEGREKRLRELAWLDKRGLLKNRAYLNDFTAEELGRHGLSRT